MSKIKRGNKHFYPAITPKSMKRAMEYTIEKLKETNNRINIEPTPMIISPSLYKMLLDKGKRHKTLWDFRYCKAKRDR